MSGYTLVGFSGSTIDRDNAINRRIPIFLPNQEIALRPHNRHNAYAYFPLTQNGKMYLILPELYKVEWFRGRYDIYDILKIGIEMCDENEVSLFYYGGIPQSKNAPEYNEWINYDGRHHGRKDGKTPKDIMNEIGQRYPGLFISEFILPIVAPPKSPDMPPPELVQSKTKKLSKQSKPVRNPSETKKLRNQRASKYPKWWLTAPNSN
jgi:hypothetical protein